MSASADRARIDVLKRQLADRETARAELASDGWTVPPSFGSLADELCGDLPEVEYVIAPIMTVGANVLLAAQYKTGKTTAALNLARSLTDGTPFLGAFGVTGHDQGGVAWWNAEVDRRMAVSWLRDMRFARPERLFAAHLRGYSVPLLATAAQDWAVEWLRAREIRTWILDPFGALYDGEENSNSEVNQWLKALDSVKQRAGVDNVVLVTHTGHASSDDGQVRARGATRLMDWPDVTWTYRGGTAELPDRRYLAVEKGRDMHLQETALDFEHLTRTLTKAVGAGSRSGDRRSAFANQAADAVRAHFSTNDKPMTKTALESALGGGDSNAKRAGIAEAVALGWIKVEDGPNRSKLHWPGTDPHQLSLANFRPKSAKNS